MILSQPRETDEIYIRKDINTTKKSKFKIKQIHNYFCDKGDDNKIYGYTFSNVWFK